MMKPLILLTLTLFLVGAPCPQLNLQGSIVVVSLSYNPAFADDDDDGGDDGAAGGAGSGGTVNAGSGTDRTRFVKFRKKFAKSPTRSNRKVVNRKKAKRRTLEVASPSEIIARNLAETQVAEIERRGFRILERRVQANGMTLLRISQKRRQSLRSARIEIRKITGDASADFNHYYRLNAAEDCQAVKCQPLQLIGLEKKTPIDCKIPRFAMIDSHVDESNAVFRNSSIEQLDMVKTGEKPLKDGHGTAVAALLAADGVDLSGAFPGADFLAINIFHTGSNGDRRADAYSLIAAIEEVRKRGILIVNLSLSGPANEPLRQAIEEAISAGVHVVAAAGNAGPSSPALYPSGYEGVFAVTALDHKLNSYRRAVRGKHIDLAAPGVSVTSIGANNRLSNYTGTSFSTPFVTAAVMATLTKNENFKPAETSALLAKFAIDLGTSGKDKVYGYGLVQVPTPCVP